MSKTSWFEELCSTAFMPHGQCYLWKTELLWLHGVSDALITLAYFSIPLTLLYFVRKRRDLPYPGLFLLFGAFIVACGTTHLMEVVTIWRPYYWVSGGIKAATATISLFTAVGLVRLLPEALALPGPEELRRLNAALEERVRARTADLSRTNDELRREIVHREQAETRHRAMFDAALDAIVTMNAKGLVVSFNPAAERIFGYTPAQALNREMAEMIIPERLRARHRAGLARVVSANLHTTHLLGQRTEIEALHADGHEFPIELAIVRIQDDPPLFTGFIRDLTERRQAEAQRRQIERKLQETQKLESLGVLAGGIAHDFNNLLTGILGNASLARLGLHPTSALVPALARIEEAAHRAADLCRQMLAYSGRGRFVVQPLDLNQLVEDTTHLLRLSISKNCELRFHLAPRLPAVKADATQMRQIIMNLVINASEAIADRNGVITLTSGVTQVDAAHLAGFRHPGEAAPGAYTFLEVSDNGCGMDADTLDLIFDPFFTTKFTGRGLGLAAVLGIIRGHGGALDVSSEPSRGSTFRLLLPCAPSEIEPAAPVIPDRPASWRGRGTVLVVDDEEPVRHTLGSILESLGFSVVFAADGREGLEKYRAEPACYAGVLLDLSMPHLGGEETFRELRQLNPAVKVILMSGFNQQEAVSHFTGQGLAGFVQKPFTVEGIAAVVRGVFEPS